jgi:hypothetical protein
MKANTWSWAVLLLLTAVSFSASDHVRSAAALILGVAGVKAALVGWQYMELHSAHPMWKAALGVILAGILGVVGVIITKG